MIFDEYCDRLTDILQQIKTTQKENILAAAEIVAQSMVSDGIIYVFGCGHSHLIALDSFYRAGGLANVSAVLDTDLMLHNGAAKSSKMEKMSGIAAPLLERYDLHANDVLLIVSTSGKNAVPVEMAKTAEEWGIPSISVVSSAYFEDKSPEELLYTHSDVYIDNCVPHGDAVMNVAEMPVKMGSVSTAASSYIVQSVLMEASAIAAQKGVDVPVYMSGNVDGGAAYNEALIRKYYPRIKHL